MSYKKNQNGGNMNDKSSFPPKKNENYKAVNINTENVAFKGAGVSSLGNKTHAPIINFGKVSKKIQHSNIKPSAVKGKASPVQYVLQTKSKVIGSKGTFIHSKVQRKMNLSIPEPTPKVYNRYSTALINDNADNVLIGLGELLQAFSDEIEFEVNKSLFEITGVVYVQNYSVNFVLTMFSENGQTRIEFRKQCGDPIYSQEFWTRLIEKMHKRFKVTEPKPDKNVQKSFVGFGSMDLDYTLLALDLDLKLDDSTSPYTKSDIEDFELSNINETMEEIYEGLQSYPKSDFSGNIIKNKKVLDAILSGLNHSDLDTIRLSLLISKELAQNFTDELLSFGIISKIVPLLSHQTDLAKKYSVQLLNVLSRTNQKWGLSKDQVSTLKEEISECHQKWSNLKFVTHNFINSLMFENINKKLIAV